MVIAQLKIYVYIPPQINPDQTLTFIRSVNDFLPVHMTASASVISHDITADELSRWGW